MGILHSFGRTRRAVAPLLLSILLLFVSTSDAIVLTNSEYNLQIGVPFTITWAEAAGLVGIDLYGGDTADTLFAVLNIASNVEGTAFTWTPPADVPARSVYALMVQDGAGNSISFAFQFLAAPPPPSATTTTPPPPPPTTSSTTSPPTTSSSRSSSSSITTINNSTSSTSSTSTPPQSTSPSLNDQNNNGTAIPSQTGGGTDNLTTAAKIGIGVSAGVGMAIIIAGSALMVIRKNKQQAEAEQQEASDRESAAGGAGGGAGWKAAEKRPDLGGGGGGGGGIEMVGHLQNGQQHSPSHSRQLSVGYVIMQAPPGGMPGQGQGIPGGSGTAGPGTPTTIITTNGSHHNHHHHHPSASSTGSRDLTPTGPSGGASGANAPWPGRGRPISRQGTPTGRRTASSLSHSIHIDDLEDDPPPLPRSTTPGAAGPPKGMI